jgi:hypothetical protein
MPFHYTFQVQFTKRSEVGKDSQQRLKRGWLRREGMDDGGAVDGGHRGEAFRQQINKINRTIKEGLQDETLLPFYAIAAVGKHGNKRHGLRIEKTKIVFGPIK